MLIKLRPALLLVFVCVALCAARPAQAQGAGAGEKANMFYQQAIELFGEGLYQEALVSLDEAIALSPEPVFYCNRGAILLKLKEFRQALTALRTCRDQYPSDDEAERAQIHSEVEGLTIAIELMEPAARRVALSVAALPKARRPSGTRETSTTEIFAWGLAGVAAVALVGAVVVDQGTLSRIDTYEEIAEEGQDKERYDALGSEIEDRQLAVGAMVVVGGLSVIGAAALFWASAESDVDGVSVGPAPTGSGVVLTWEEGF